MIVEDSPKVIIQEGLGADPPDARPPSRATVKVTIGLLLILILAGGIAYRGIAARLHAATKVMLETRELAVPTVSAVQPKLTAPREEIVLPGNIQAFIDAPIYARTNGYLRRWYVDIGGRVKANELLAEIDTPELDQQLSQAQADLATAKANHDLANTTAARYENLFKTDSVAKQDVDNAVGEARAKKAMVESAADNVKRLEQLQSFEKIYAPFDGVLTARNIDIGQLIDSGSGGGPAKELFHVAAIETLRVYVKVPQIYSRSAVPGVQAYLTLPQFPGRSFPGRLVRTAESIEQSSRTLLTEVDVANPSGALLPGAYAEVHLKLPSAGSTVIVPVTCLVFRSEGLRVGVVRDGKAVLVPVSLGRDFGTEVEVTSGLEASDSVITNPPDSLVSGAEVRLAAPDAGSRGGK
jgi:RND family efflux transporter MFP subunit